MGDPGDPIHGVDIRPGIDPGTGENVSLDRTCEPGAIIEIPIVIENTGTGPIAPDRDAIEVKIENRSENRNWSMRINIPPDQGILNPDHVMLASNETANIYLIIYAPFEADFGEHAVITISATLSVNSSATDNITVRVDMDLRCEFSCRFLKQPSQDPLDPLVGQKWDAMEPGEESFYNMTINNLGNLNDTYLITLSEPPEDTGWDWYFIETGTRNDSVRISSSIFEQLGQPVWTTRLMKVICPLEALYDSKVEITLKCTSEKMREVGIDKNVTDDLIIVGKKIIDLEISTNGTRSYLTSMKPLNITYQLTNKGNCPLEVIMTFHDGESGWDIRYPGGYIDVEFDETVYLNVTIIGRLDIGEERTCQAIFSVGDLNFTAPNITLIDGIVGGFNVTGWLRFKCDPGEKTNGSVTISSLSEGNVSVEMDVDDIPRGWFLKTSPHSIGSGFILGPWEEVMIDVNISIPKEALAGEYPINITVRSDTLFDMVSVLVTVNHKRVLIIEPGEGVEKQGISVHDGDVTVPARGNRTFEVLVRNKGNGPDRFRLVLGDGKAYGVLADCSFGIVSYGELNDGSKMVWGSFSPPLSKDDIAFRTLDMDIALNGTVWVTIFIEAPLTCETMMISKCEMPISILDDYIPGTELPISPHYDPEPMTRIDIFLSFAYPDLSVSDFRFETDDPGRFIEGRSYSFEVQVLNQGIIRVRDVKVVVTLNGDIVWTEVIGSMEPGSFSNFTVVFKVKSGLNNISVVIDPDDEIIEIKSNNEYSVEFNALADTGTGVLERVVLFSLIISAVVAITIMILIFFYLGKAKRSRIRDQEE